MDVHFFLIFHCSLFFLHNMKNIPTYLCRNKNALHTMYFRGIKRQRMIFLLIFVDLCLLCSPKFISHENRLVVSLRYSWKRADAVFSPEGNEDRVVQMRDEGTIIINRPEDKDEGFYQCFAKNNFGVYVRNHSPWQQILLFFFN